MVRSSTTPAAGAVVMGTGIVSVGLSSDGHHTLSVVLLVITAVVWVALGLGLAWRAFGNWPAVSREARSPAALTSVAATAVLGARVTGLGWNGLAAVLLVIATVLWLVLLPLVLSRPSRRAGGVAFMTTVSTQSLAVLASQLAVQFHAPWLLFAGLALICLGLVLYVLVLANFDFRQLVAGRGDHWVSGGALAISTLAVAEATVGARALHSLAPAAGALRGITLALWVLSAAWLPALVLCEALRPRLGYDVRRWATVFPVGMYTACSFDAGLAAYASALTDFARVWVWFGVALWVVVFASMLWQPFCGERASDRAAASATQ